MSQVQFKEAVIESIDPIVKTFLEKGRDHMFALTGEKNLTADEKAACYAALRSFNNDGIQFYNSFMVKVNTGLDKSESSEPLVKKPLELSLVEKDDFEDELARASIIKDVEECYYREVNELKRKFGSNNPASPEVIGKMFQESLSVLGLDRQSIKTCHRLFKEIFVDKAGEMYTKLNTLVNS